MRGEKRPKRGTRRQAAEERLRPVLARAARTAFSEVPRQERPESGFADYLLYLDRKVLGSEA